jgi:hypothetical protein
MTHVRLTKIDRILSAQGDLQPLVAKTRDLRALAGHVQAFLSADLARQIRVGPIRDGQLTLVAANSAAAAKLKLLGPALSQFLLEQRFQVNSVSVRVQPNAARRTVPLREKTVQLSTHALESLRTLHERLAPSPARDALARMLRRHGALRGPKER